jgi:Uma2 family endonuclease
MQFVEKDKLFSLEAYLAFEEASETRHELYQGNLIEMSGTTTIHNEIVGNIYMILRNFLKGAIGKYIQKTLKLELVKILFFIPM